MDLYWFGLECEAHVWGMGFEEREHSVRRQMTCPNTPPHNGVVERKLAHLTSMCLS